MVLKLLDAGATGDEECVEPFERTLDRSVGQEAGAIECGDRIAGQRDDLDGVGVRVPHHRVGFGEDVHRTRDIQHLDSGNGENGYPHDLGPMLGGEDLLRDLPLSLDLEETEVIREVARRDLTLQLYERRRRRALVDLDDLVVARKPSRLCGRAAADRFQPFVTGQWRERAVLLVRQRTRRMEDGGELVGIAFVQSVEISLRGGFDGLEVVRHVEFPLDGLVHWLS